MVTSPVAALNAVHAGKSRTELDAERGRCIARSAELSGYGRLSGAQVQEADSLIAEQIVLDDLIARDDVAARSESIARGRAAMADPGNREGRPGRRRWCTGSVTGGRPRPRRSSG